MSEIIQGLLWNSRIGKWFSFGQRWLLLVPFAVVLVVLTVLASSHFELIQEAFGLPSSQEIVTNRYFIIVSVVLVLVGPVSFVVMTRWPPPKNRFAIMVSKFYPI